MAVFDSVKKRVEGNVAHDAADSGNPVKMGGKASTSTPAAVANGDRVDTFHDERGRVAVFDGNSTLSVDDGGGTLTVDGAVTVSDGGGSLTVDGAVTVSDGGGSLTVDGTVGVSGTVSTQTGGDTNAGASDAGRPVKIGGKANAATPSNEDDGDRVNAYFDQTGRLAVFAGHDDSLEVHDADAVATLESIQGVLVGAKGRQAPASALSVIRATTAETALYGSASVGGHSTNPVLYRKNSDVVDGAATAIAADFGFARFVSSADDIFYFLPTRQYRRLMIALTNLLNVSLNVSLFGILARDSSVAQVAVLLASTVTVAVNNSAIFGMNSKATGASGDLYAIPNIGDWDYIALKCEAVANAGSGSVQMLVNRDT